MYYWTDARQHGLYLFYIIKKQTTTDKAFFSESFTITRNSAFAHLGEHGKKPFDVIYCLYKMQQSHWLLYVAKNYDWLRKITLLSNMTWKLLLAKWKLTAKAELNCEIYSSWWNTGKVKSVFVIRVALWVEKLGCCLKYCRILKNTLGKLAVVANTGGYSIRVLNERNVRDGGNLCPLWLVILKSVWYSVGDTL